MNHKLKNKIYENGILVKKECTCGNIYAAYRIKCAIYSTERKNTVSKELLKDRLRNQRDADLLFNFGKTRY